MSRLRGARLREVAVPDWLVEVARPRQTPVPWGQMARAALAICGPLALGVALGQQAHGLLAAMGGLLATLVDRDGPYRARVRGIAVAAVFGGAAGLVVGGLIHGRGWLAVAGIAAVAGVSALLSAISATWSQTGLQLLVYASFGLGPVGGLRPWWAAPLLLLAGAAWGAALLVPGWALFPRSGQERRVAEVYRALAVKLRAVGTPRFAHERQGVTAALNAAYDEFLTARSAASGRDREQARLVALLNQAHLVAEASTTLGQSGRRPTPDLIDVADRVADAVHGEGPPPRVPPVPADAPAGLAALHDGLSGAAGLLAGRRPPGGAEGPARASRSSRERGPWARARLRSRERIRDLAEEFRGGGLVWVFTLRLVLCTAVAALVSEFVPVQRSYWVVLTVAIVLKPDFGSVFARAVQRGVGTVLGAVAGAALVAIVPYGPYLLVPVAVSAALLPYGRSRNYGLFSVFLTPLVVLLIDLLVRGGWRLAQARLVDTVIGCAIVLLVGYAPWPGAWHVDLPRKFADAAEDVARYLERALLGGPGKAAGRAQLRRRTYRALSDLRAEFQRTMTEPAAVSRRATAWWPALVALERVMDAATALAVAVDHGGAPPSAGAVGHLADVVREVADEARSGGPPAGVRRPAGGRLPREEPLAPVSEAVRAVQGALAGSATDA